MFIEMVIPRIRSTLLLLFLVYVIKASEIDYLKALDDLITYKISFKSNNEKKEFHEEDDDATRWVTMKSADEEEYRCLLPVIQTDTRKKIESYSGPTPAELLQPLYDEKYCSIRIESYWAYEFCHGQYILQYHSEKESKKRIDYLLGNYAKTQAEAEAAKFDQLNPPKRKFMEEVLAYYTVTYSHGTNCDLTNKPRQTTVLYVCDEVVIDIFLSSLCSIWFVQFLRKKFSVDDQKKNPQNDSKASISSLTEISSCNYEIVIKTNRLCAHPSFQSAPNIEHDINCFATDANQANAKPHALLSIEHESTSNFWKQFTPLKTADNSNNLFTRLLQADDSFEGAEQLSMILDAIRASTMKKNALLPPKSINPSEDLRLIEMFWNGKACFIGGTGRWKYEVCHGQTVMQYHEEQNKERSNILLGVFHKEVHKKWALENPLKARKMENGKVYQIGNMYTQGDICPETGAHRNCEVRMRCQEKGSTSKVLLYLMEPKPCEHVVVIESPLMCEGIKKADKDGILPDMPSLSGLTTIPEAKEVPSEHQGDTISIFKVEELSEAVTTNPHLPAEQSERREPSKPMSNSGRALKDIFGGLINDDTVVELLNNLDEFNDILIKKNALIFNQKEEDDKEDDKLSDKPKGDESESKNTNDDDRAGTTEHDEN